MADKPLSTAAPVNPADVLDHSREFTDLVAAGAAQEYATLLASGRFGKELEQQGAFNHGKLYAYAEFVVFRREFKSRFPDASPAACINAFAGLLLKNDISISNLVEYVEGGGERAQLEQNTVDKS